MNTGNFRKTLFGGFNRNDVSAYIVKLAAERNEYKERAEQAEEKLAAVEARMEETVEETVEKSVSEEPIEEAEIPETAEEPAEEEVPEEAQNEEPQETVETDENGPVEMEHVVREIVENVSNIQMEKAILEIVENVNAIQNEINDREKLVTKTGGEDLADSINRVLGMLECTEAQFSLLAKTLKEIKSDVSVKDV